jgi:hypothetical protein
MHEDTIEPFWFPAVGRKKVAAAFDGGRLTSDGGVMLLSAAERRIGIAQRLARLIADPRNPLLVTHSVVLRARMLAIACGYEDADDLDHLRDHISRILAARMFDQFHAGRSVIWTSNLEFTPEGIRYRPSGFLGRKEPQLLPFSEYSGYDLKQGVFHLFARGHTKSVMTEQAAVENFYPGFFLLLMLLHQQASEQVAS